MTEIKLCTALFFTLPFTVARQSDVDAKVVETFLKNAACHNLVANVTLPQEKGWL